VRSELPPEPEPTARLAVLPFSAGAQVPEYLGAAVAEETLVRLSRHSAAHDAPFTLLAQDSVFTLAAQGHSAVQVGRALRAHLVLTGTLTAQASHYRLRAELIRVADDVQLWVEDFIVPQSRIAGLECALAERLAFRLGVQPAAAGLNLAAAAEPDTNRPDPSKPDTRLQPPADDDALQRQEAYERFQRAHQDLHSPQPAAMKDGLQNLLRASELDPSLTSAQIDLIHLCMKQAIYGILSPAVAAEQARRAARAIPQEYPGAEAVFPALGWIRFHIDRNLDGALHAFENSAHLPHDSWTTRWRVTFALSRARWEEAIQLIESALRQDPFSPWLHAQLAWAWHLGRQPQESVAQIESTLDLFPLHETACLYGAIILASNGRSTHAIQLGQQLTRSMPHCDIASATHAFALACAGHKAEAATLVERLQWMSRERYVASSFLPAVCLLLGDTETAIDELRAAEEARCPWFFQMLADPRLDALHGHPEFVRMQGTLAAMEAGVARNSTIRDRRPPLGNGTLFEANR
jgi:TolB-like protein/tetratricopeptide (TPR) repeat protein